MNRTIGLCQCGCGGVTNLAVRSNSALKWVKGQPYPYLSNHRKRIKPSAASAVEVTVEGEKCYLIPLTKGKVATISAHRLERVLSLKWRARKNFRSGTWYAMRTQICGGKKVTVMMHNFILGANPREVDHRNLDGLDNRDGNLRFCSGGENHRNVGLRTDNTSGYKGVSWHSRTSKWTANICLNSSRRSLGYFSTKEAAAKSYDRAATELHREFARLNFPPTSRAAERL